MFKVNEYKIVFKRVWHERRIGIRGRLASLQVSNGRYDTKCEIYVQDLLRISSKINGLVYYEKPSFTGIARLHPKDTPDKIIGKKIALRNALTKDPLGSDKPIRTLIWRAFWNWVSSWSPEHEYIYGERS